jgi:DNA-binding response OmpR family regulator
MVAKNQAGPICMLMSDLQIRKNLHELLAENYFSPQLVATQEELLQLLKKNQFSIVMIDCGSVSLYGARIISKIKVVCRYGRIIIFCDKQHLCDGHHRSLIKEVLAIGIYACIVAPYEEWEVLSLVTHDYRLEKK